MKKSLTEVRYLNVLPVLQLIRVRLILEAAVETALIDVYKCNNVSPIYVAHALQKLGICVSLVGKNNGNENHIDSIAIGKDQIMTNFLRGACQGNQERLKYSLLGVPLTAVAAIIDPQYRIIRWKVPERMRLNPLASNFTFSVAGMPHEILLLDHLWDVARTADPLLAERWYAEKNEESKESSASIHESY